jgi:hypothetical protein
MTTPRAGTHEVGGERHDAVGEGRGTHQRRGDTRGGEVGIDFGVPPQNVRGVGVGPPALPTDRFTKYGTSAWIAASMSAISPYRVRIRSPKFRQ